MSATPSNRLRLRLSPRSETAVRSGHPWIYGDSVREQNRPGQPGELAIVYDRRDRFLAAGFFDPDSPIRVRVLQRGKPAPIDAAFWRERVRAARAVREVAGVFDDDTTGGRWINGESDGLPGLVADRYADTLVVKLYTAAWFPIWEEIEAILRDILAPRHVLVRLSRNLGGEALQRWQFTEGFRGGGGDDPVVFRESGLFFEAAVRHGQKTGFFLDQRENRRRVETLAAGRDTLNAFSFSGAFSVYAARGRARSVTDLDLSAHALAGARRNFARNASHPAVASCRHESLQADAFRWLAESPPGRFDLVILDPPSLAPREADRAAAIRAYGALAGSALRLLRPGGLLVAASCSSHVTAPEFFQAVRFAANQSGHAGTERWTSGHAPDHPATFPEASYLKAICLGLR